MMRKLFGAAVLVLLPAVVAAQTPQAPSAHASDRAKSMVAEHRATHRRGEVAMDALDRTPGAATPATRAARATAATPATLGAGAAPASPATPATPAIPATPSHRGGQSLGHRP